MLEVLLVGCGQMAAGWLSALASDEDLASRTKVVGLVDLDLSRARELAARFQLSDAKVGSDLDQMLGALKPDIVFDVVVPEARRTVVATAFEHGCDVLSEKPLATNLEDARELVALAKAHAKKHAVVQNRRFVTGVRRIRRAVREGLIGEINAIQCDFYIGFHIDGFRTEMAHPLLLDMAIHPFDAARYMVGQTPSSVYCVEQNPLGSWFTDGAAAHAIFKFENGTTFTYRGSWCAEGEYTSWEGAWRVVGSKGTLLWDGGDRIEASVSSDEKLGKYLRVPVGADVPDPDDANETRGHASVIRSFVNGLQGKDEAETASHDNINSLAMVMAAIKSAESGGVEKIDTGLGAKIS